MNDEAAITIYQEGDNQELLPASSYTSRRGASIEAIIGAWLHAKEQRSHSAKTLIAYRSTIADFRMLLVANGLDLIWDDANFVPTVADYAQVFAVWRSPKSRRKGDVSPATQGQRLAILSSFYLYCIKRQHIDPTNPILLVDRPHIESYAQAEALEQQEVEKRLRSIDSSTLQGARDLALLLVLLSTGRRASEVASLQVQHLHLAGKAVVLSFPHLKGGKTARDTLSLPVSKALLQWVIRLYGERFFEVDATSPLWVNIYHQSKYGEPLGYHGISGVCAHYLGTSKVHTTRHTLAVLMELAGAKITDIQHQLRHANAATTGEYMERIHPTKNPYAEKVAALLGLHEGE